MAMSDENTIQNPENDGQDTTPAGAKKSDNLVPQWRLDEMARAKNEALERLAKLEAEQREKETKLLAEQGEYKKLYEAEQAEKATLLQAKAELEQFKADLEQRNKERLALIPEEKRGLIPEYDDPVKLGKWLDRNHALITEQAKPLAPNLGGGAGGAKPQNPAKLSDEELSFARLAGMSPEKYAEQKAKRGEAVTIEDLRNK
jgi:hypothetical protein